MRENEEKGLPQCDWHRSETPRMLSMVLGAHLEKGTCTALPNSCSSEECNPGCLGLETKLFKVHLKVGDGYLERER